jgi:predicted nucleic acid-binding Zn ribbon protein
MSKMKKDRISSPDRYCIECGKMIGPRQRAISGLCSNACRKIHTIKTKEEEDRIWKIVLDNNNRKSGRKCITCGEEIVGPNMFFCINCFARKEEGWLNGTY